MKYLLSILSVSLAAACAQAMEHDKLKQPDALQAETNACYMKAREKLIENFKKTLQTSPAKKDWYVISKGYFLQSGDLCFAATKENIFMTLPSASELINQRIKEMEEQLELLKSWHKEVEKHF